MVGRYLSKTRQDLDDLLLTLDFSENLVHKIWIKKLKSLHNMGYILVPTDKNLGLALIDRNKFNDLQRKELEELNLELILNKSEQEIAINLKQEIYTLLNAAPNVLSNKDRYFLERNLSNRSKLPIFHGIFKNT